LITKPSLRTGFFAFWKSLKAIGNYRLSPVPVFIFYEVQPFKTVRTLYSYSHIEQQKSRCFGIGSDSVM
ncbi:hypothetical protein C1Y48_15300, partial [Vibrio cholerae]